MEAEVLWQRSGTQARWCENRALQTDSFLRKGWRKSRSRKQVSVPTTDIHAKADAFELPWHKDEFLLLCSDGLVNTVSDQEMLFEVLHDGDVNECLDHLLQISLQRGAPDNITAVLLLNEEGR